MPFHVAGLDDNRQDGDDDEDNRRKGDDEEDKEGRVMMMMMTLTRDLHDGMKMIWQPVDDAYWWWSVVG